MTVAPTLSIPPLVQGFRYGALSLSDYLTQVEAYFNSREPEVLAFLPEDGRFERLQREAVALAERWPDPSRRPALFGILVGVKDIFQVAGFTTQAGSHLPAEELQGEEAASIKALKEAGALIMGKTVTTEFAFFGSGPTRNPYNADHTPGGSSSGSAAAVGGGLIPLALGTQTIGSVIRPAAFCGCVGYKPTYERISRAGIIPLSPSFDHVGIFAADVAGVNLAASVLDRDWRPESASARWPVLGIPQGPYLERATPEMLAHFRVICSRLADAGYQFKSIDVMPDFTEIFDRHYFITAADAARVHKNWFPRYRDLYHPRTVELLERGRGISDDALAEALKDREAFSSEIRALMTRVGVDLWVSPAAIGPATKGLESTGDPVMNLPWSQSGQPALSLPSGLSADGLPLGLQLVAQLNHDESLFGWAKDIEKVLRASHSN